MSPERSNSPQDEAVVTPKMSVPASPVAGTPIREAQSPISLLLAVAHSQNRNGDDDLTSLSWLHERDLLKGMNIDPSPLNSVNSTPVKYSNSVLSDQYPTSDYVDECSTSTAESSNSSLNSPISYCQTPVSAAQRNKHPHHIPYDPLVHTSNKPPFSFSCLIFMAIEDSPQKALPVKEIYTWILGHFPYFKNAPTGWKNSVRHNLSLNKCFQKVEKAPNLGKGSLWTVDEQYKPNLIQALTRSPFQPTSNLDPSVFFGVGNAKSQPNAADKGNPARLPNPDLYPYLSKKLAAAEMQTKGARIKSETSDESLDAVDAATVMLSLKNGPRYRSKKDKGLWQVITTSPSQDHTYSAANALAADEAFESDEERPVKNNICRKIDFEDEEERKIKEGAETLLNLAGISTRKRHNSGSQSCAAETATYKKLRTVLQCDIINQNEEGDERPAPFKPRLLRTKKKETRPKAPSLDVAYNNNNTSSVNNNDEWVKHRRELEINQLR